MEILIYLIFNRIKCAWSAWLARQKVDQATSQSVRWPAIISSPALVLLPCNVSTESWLIGSFNVLFFSSLGFCKKSFVFFPSFSHQVAVPGECLADSFIQAWMTKVKSNMLSIEWQSYPVLMKAKPVHCNIQNSVKGGSCFHASLILFLSCPLLWHSFIDRCLSNAAYSWPVPKSFS